MTKERKSLVRIKCTECTFSKVISEDDEKLPAEVLIEHGNETGHRVVPKPIDEQD